jgi:hypothetical protein
MAAGGKRQINFGFLVTGVHDSNLAGGQGSTPATGPSGSKLTLTPEDTTWRPSANFSVVQPLGRQSVFVRGTVGYDFHQNNPRLNSNRVDVSSGASLSSRACQTALVGDYSTRQTELIDATQLSVQNQQESTTVSLNGGCGARGGAGVQLGLQRQDVSNSVAIQKLADHSLQSVTLGLTYGRPTLGNVILAYSYSDQDYPNRINALGGVGDSYANQSIGLTFKKSFGTRLSLVAGASESIVQLKVVRAGMSKTSSNVNYNVAVTYTVNQRLDLGLNASRATKPSNQAGGLFDVVTGGGLNANYKIGSRFALGAGATYLESVSNGGSPTVPVLATITNSRTNSYFASIRYNQSSKASVTLDVRQEDRTTNLPTFDYSDTRISLTTAVNF